MPEGDTIHRAARTLRGALVGAPIAQFDAPRLSPPFPVRGTVVSAVEARGKHLLIDFDDGHVLHTHMGMPGSWHVYPSGGALRRRDLRVRIDTDEVTAVCFGAPVVELLDHQAVERHPGLRRLGPDLCVEDPDIATAVARMGEIPAPTVTIGEALLDQRVAAGIGNVYRSEVCFLEGIDPRAPLSSVPESKRAGLLDRAARLLRRNLTTIRRTTVPGGPDGALFVYGRGGSPCRRCRTPIASTVVGEHARVTYWCPCCQPSRA